MKRMLWLAAAAVGLLTSAEMASAAGPGPRSGSGDVVQAAFFAGPGGTNSGKYGLNPLFSRGAWGKKSVGGCDTCGDGRGRAYGPAMGPGGPDMMGYPGPGMPGTLVFPNHPYTRSPRDFFMWTPR